MAWPDPRSWRRSPLWREGPLTSRAEVEECRRLLGQRPSTALDELWALEPEDWVTALDEATE